MNCTERFLKYIAVSTPSDESVENRTPTTDSQFLLAKLLADEMKESGFESVRVDEYGFVYGLLPASEGCADIPVLGLIAHMDTAPSFNGVNVNPQLISNYDGGDVLLRGSGEYLSTKSFPQLKKMIGHTLITTDGTTLLGADDKAGIAEIMTACELLIKNNIAHGSIAVAFTPDEETGTGIKCFDVQHFPAKMAYTVDGGELGRFGCENFNACKATIEFAGFSVHPGSSKDTMINANLLALEFASMLPSAETPRDTENREGFYHLEEMHGDAVTAKLVYIVRDHDKAVFEGRKAQLRHIEKILNHRWGKGRVKLTIQDQYENMFEIIKQYPKVVENVKLAMREVGMTYCEEPIRGGTDGARLSYQGLPCPNLPTGGYAYHGPYEHISSENMEKAVQLIETLCQARFWKE